MKKTLSCKNFWKRKQTNWKQPEETNQLWSIFPGAWHIYVCNGEFPNVFGRTAIAWAQAQDPILLEGGPNEDNLRKVRVQGDWLPPFCVICRNLSFEYISVSWSRAVNNFNVFFFKIYLFLRSIHSTDSTSNQFLPFFFKMSVSLRWCKGWWIWKWVFPRVSLFRFPYTCLFRCGLASL